jgi:hypothetical protein
MKKKYQANHSLKLNDYVKVVSEENGDGSGIIGKDFILAVGYVKSIIEKSEKKNLHCIEVESITNKIEGDGKTHSFRYWINSDWNTFWFEKIDV